MIDEQAKVPDYEQPKLLTKDINEKMDGKWKSLSNIRWGIIISIVYDYWWR